MKRKRFSGKRLCASVLATILGLSPAIGDGGLLMVEAAGVATGAGSYSTEIVGQYSYGDGNGGTVYVDNSKLAEKLPYEGSAYRYTTDNYDANNGAFDTTNWATSFMWDLNGNYPYSYQVYAIPLAYKGENYGLQLTAPSSLSDTANKVYTMQMAENGSITDFYIKSGFTSSCTKVDAVTDWSYDVIWENSSNASQQMKATLVQGVPFAYFEMTGTNSFTVERGGKSGLPSVVVTQSNDGSGVIVRCFDNGDNDYDYYAFYASSGTSWNIDKTDTHISSMTATLPSGKEYVSVAYLGSTPNNPDDAWAMQVGETYARYAYNYITDTKATYSYNESTSTVTTTYTYTFDKKAESSADGTIMGILPHQYKNMEGASFANYTYQTVRGTMKTMIGSSFTTNQTYSGILPWMPDIEDEYNGELSSYLEEYTSGFGNDYFENYEGSGDTYWDGKGLNRLANAMIAAEDAGDTETAERLLNALKSRLENWLTYSGSNDDAYFYYDDGVGSLFGFPQSYSSVDQMNDHHFHYGYFIYAAAQVAMRVDGWGDDNQYGAMIKELIYDIACPTRNSSSSRYPYLRAFAPYEGHSWASGHQNFGMGNNQESSSEALNAWAGIILFAEATNDTELRDLGVYLYTTESEAVNNYWFDVDEDVLSDAYRYGVPNAAVSSINKETDEVKFNSAAIVWGGSYCYATWFSANPLHIQGINLLPMNPTGFYLAGNKEYIEENIRLAYKYAAEGGWSQTEWIDIWCQYQALADPDAALTRWQAAETAGYGVEGGETKAHTYHFIRSLCRYGTPDTTITGDCTLSTAFVKDGVKTYAAYNASDAPITVTFSDGGSITVAANSMYAGLNGTGNGAPAAGQASYKIQYYKENLAQNGYDLAGTSTYNAAIDSTIDLDGANAGLVRNYTGFTLNKNASGTKLSGSVASDGGLVLAVYYDRESYNISYELNGGTNGSNPSGYVYGSTVSLADPTRADYYFGGWYTDSALTQKFTSITSSTSGDLKLYAKWNSTAVEDPSTDESGYTWSNGTATFYYKGIATGTVYIATYDTLQQAQQIAEQANANAPGFDYVTGHGGYTLNAEGDYAKATYTVAEGKYMVYAFNPSNAGVGDWYVGVAQASGSGGGDDTEQTTYTIQYENVDGANNPNASTYVEGVGLTLVDATKSGYTFDGWYKESSFTNKVTSISTTDTGNKTLYAKWTKNSSSDTDPSEPIGEEGFTYSNGTVTFYHNSSAVGTVYVAVFDTLEAAEDAASEANANHPGFDYVEEAGLVLNVDGNYVTATYAVAEGKYIVYAFNPENAGVEQWQVGQAVATTEKTAKYTVNYYLQNTARNGYTKDSASCELEDTVGKTVTVSAKGYTGFTYDASKSNLSGTVLEDGSLELAIYYTRNTYDVKYNNVDGATNGNAATYVYGVGLSLADPTKSGYTFGGWYSDSGFTSKVTSISGTQTGTVTLYAKWTQNAGGNTEPSNPTGESGFTYSNGVATFYYEGATKGIVYIATYDTKAQADAIAAEANANAPGFDYVTGHGGYNLVADGNSAKVDYAVAAGKYVVYAFNPDNKGVESWNVGVIPGSATAEKQNGTASVTMANWIYGATASKPVPKSTTNGTTNVTYQYKVQGAADSTYTSVVPSTVGKYTVKATFAATNTYNAVIATANFEIQKATLKVTGATAVGRVYDGTTSVGITSVVLGGIVSGDEVAVVCTNLKGTISSANAGTYNSVILPTLTLTGADRGNYTLVQPTTAVALTKAVTITDTSSKPGDSGNTGGGNTDSGNTGEGNTDSGNNENVGGSDSVPQNGWLEKDGEKFWYENGERQGTEGRGKEIYDPSTNAWYWLDAVDGGKIAVNKDVYQESLAGPWGDVAGSDGQRYGKWVRYDANGHMVKGWQVTESGTYFFDYTYGTMAKGYALIDGKEYYFNIYSGLLEEEYGEAPANGWKTIDGKDYWYENYVRQGYSADATYRGKEIFDPSTNAWYWLDNVQNGAKAVSKDVYQESLAGDWGDYTGDDGQRYGKWVRYDENGHMIKGWSADNQYYFDPVYGTMAKGSAVIDGVEYYFDTATGTRQ